MGREGAGQPVVLSHGYSLAGHSRERQTRGLLAAAGEVNAALRTVFD